MQQFFTQNRPTRRIDIDKMKAAFAATSKLVQCNWSEEDREGGTALCAMSALLSYAGVNPTLITKMHRQMPGDTWVHDFLFPVLYAEYNISREVVGSLVVVFDRAENPYLGIQRVLETAERFNAAELAKQAAPGATTFSTLDALAGQQADGEYIDIEGNVGSSPSGLIVFPSPKQQLLGSIKGLQQLQADYIASADAANAKYKYLDVTFGG